MLLRQDTATGFANLAKNRVKELMPDATYSSWSRISESLTRAISHPTVDPVVPDTVFAGYSRTPLTKKLGIKEDMAAVSDLSEPYVRKTGPATGLVDYKICAIDKTWSGLLFTRRKS